MKISSFALLSLVVLFIFSCSDDEISPGKTKPTTYGQFEVQADNSIIIDGVINSQTPVDLEELIEDHPNVNKIVFKQCSGAQIGTSTLTTARLIRSNQMDTHLTSDGDISRGGLDLFLAGTNRTMDSSGMIGVGGWRTALGQEAKSFEFGHDNHTDYINYYVEMGFIYLDAADFYYFSIYAADSDEIYYLNDDQIEDFGILK